MSYNLWITLKRRMFITKLNYLFRCSVFITCLHGSEKFGGYITRQISEEELDFTSEKISSMHRLEFCSTLHAHVL